MLSRLFTLNCLSPLISVWVLDNYTVVILVLLYFIVFIHINKVITQTARSGCEKKHWRIGMTCLIRTIFGEYLAERTVGPHWRRWLMTRWHGTCPVLPEGSCLTWYVTVSDMFTTETITSTRGSEREQNRTASPTRLLKYASVTVNPCFFMVSLENNGPRSMQRLDFVAH